ncbi:MAG TPA: hypothetical protein VFN09_06025 [Rhodanobacteraceae bacterium]|nr:hypothetical protein [Rhodanobacteraceae bacterium]
MLLTVDASCPTLRSGSASTALPRLMDALGYLPRLGSVVCQARPHAVLPTAMLERWLQGVGASMPVASHPWLHGLLRVTTLRAVSRIDSYGPHECLELAARNGEVQLRIWLLPDSDFYAWDSLLRRHAIPAVAEPLVEPTCLERLARRLSRQRQPRWHGGVVQFRLQRLAGLHLLDVVPATVSALGCERAARLLDHA